MNASRNHGLLSVLLLVAACTALGQAPSISGISPSSATAGAPSFTLTVSGSGFVAPLLILAGSGVNWNGSPLQTTFVSTSQLQASVPASMVASPGNASVIVANPDGSQSNAVTFVINPVTTLLSITTTSPLPGGTVGLAYSQTLSATGGTPPYSWSVAAGVLPAGLSLSPSGVISGTPSTAGTFSFTVQVSDSKQGSVSKSFSLTITAASAPPSITTASPLPSGTVGAAYSQTLSATGGTPPYSWSVTGGALPAGLSLSASGSISGTPTASGTFSFTAQVTDSKQASASKAFSVTINSASTPVSITTTSPLPSGTVGAAYSQSLAAVGGTPPYSWAVIGGALPPGLTLSANGSVSGTPLIAGTSSFTVQVTDSKQANASKDFSLNINATPTPVSITTTSPLPSGTVGAAYSQTLSATGGTSPYSWSVVGGALPGGMTLSTSGSISGTPATAGTFGFTVQVTDSAQGSNSKAFALTINAAPSQLMITTIPPLPDGTVGAGYSQTLGAAGGSPPYFWSVAAGSLPAGLSLSSSGVLQGTPSSPGVASFIVQVTDSATGRVIQAYSLRIAAGSTPQVIMAGLSATVAPAQQVQVNLQLATAYPSQIDGEIDLTFTPNAAVSADDPAVQFSTGGRRATFTIPANSTQAVFSMGQLQLQTGTVAGTISLTAKMQSGGADITPSPPPTMAARLDRLAPQISQVKVTRNGSGFSVAITGLSTSREMTQATFVFSGANVQSTVAVDLNAAFTAWYQQAASASFGSQFTLTQPFTVQGDASTVTSVSVTLTNAQGASIPAGANF